MQLLNLSGNEPSGAAAAAAAAIAVSVAVAAIVAAAFTFAVATAQPLNSENFILQSPNPAIRAVATKCMTAIFCLFSNYYG